MPPRIYPLDRQGSGSLFTSSSDGKVLLGELTTLQSGICLCMRTVRSCRVGESLETERGKLHSVCMRWDGVSVR